MLTDTSGTPNPSLSNLESSATVGASSLDARGVIDNEIEDLYERIRARKLDRNNLAPISKIPVELLSYIFSLVQRKYRQNPREDLGWVVVTHVCQRWRDIARDNPALWVYIPFHRPKWIPEMTRRSRSATFKIKLDFRSFTLAQFSALRLFLAVHLPRVRSITVHRPLLSESDIFLQTLFQELPARSAQCLEHFNVRYPARYSHTFNPMLSVEKVLIDPPCLKKLKIYGAVDWSSKILTSLTHFILYSDGRKSTESPHTYSEFLDALARMPALRKLHLHKVPLPAPPTEKLSSKSFNIVHLSQLQSILLSGSASTVYNILRHISLPEGTRFRLTLKVSMASDVAAIAALFPGRYTSTNVAIKCPLARSLKISIQEDYAHLSAWSHSSQDTTLDSGLSFPDDEDPFLKINLLWLPSSSSHIQEELNGQAILEMCSALPFRSLTTLSVTSEVEPAGINAESLAEAFGHQPELHSVNVDGPALKAFLGFLAASAQKGNSSKATVNLPSLRYLSICYRKFQRSRWLSLQVLQDILAQRNQLGMKLKHVHLERCSHLFASDVKIMRENAHKVTWDKFVDVHTTSESSSSSEDGSDSDGSDSDGSDSSDSSSSSSSDDSDEDSSNSSSSGDSDEDSS
jgi:hypothetical protein